MKLVLSLLAALSLISTLSYGEDNSCTQDSTAPACFSNAPQTCALPADCGPANSCDVGQDENYNTILTRRFHKETFSGPPINDNPGSQSEDLARTIVYWCSGTTWKEKNTELDWGKSDYTRPGNPLTFLFRKYRSRDYDGSIIYQVKVVEEFSLSANGTETAKTTYTYVGPDEWWSKTVQIVATITAITNASGVTQYLSYQGNGTDYNRMAFLGNGKGSYSANGTLSGGTTIDQLAGDYNMSIANGATAGFNDNLATIANAEGLLDFGIFVKDEDSSGSWAPQDVTEWINSMQNYNVLPSY